MKDDDARLEINPCQYFWGGSAAVGFLQSLVLFFFTTSNIIAKMADDTRESETKNYAHPTAFSAEKPKRNAQGVILGKDGKP